MTRLTDAEIEEWKNRHIPYRLQMLDGLRWWCEFRTSGKDHPDLAVTVNGRQVCASVLTNGVAESGLMACRFLLEFLGIGAAEDDSSPTGCRLVSIAHRPTDVWAERIDCESARPDDFAPAEGQACAYTHKLASQGVGHPTKGREGANLTWLILAANAVERAIGDRVYLSHGPAIRSPLWFVGSPE